MISMDQQVKSSWAQVDNQLQRRFDLIPNLVNTVKGYVAHEKSILEEVTRLRSQWATASNTPEKVETANALTSALSKLMMVSESYPNLKANENFLALQSQIEGTENRISVERMRYNHAVEKYNAYQQSFFGRFFASQTGITQPGVYFKSTETAAQVPVVTF
jgi:LemA protein